jgi:hypothetical protein
VLELFQNRRDQRAGQTLEVAELFQDNGGVRVATKVNRLSAGPAVGESCGRGWQRWR